MGKPITKPRPTWTKKELAFIRNKWGVLTRSMIAKKLKRALASINRVANEMGLAVHAVKRATYDDARSLPQFVICSQDGMCQAYVADLADNERAADRALEHLLKVGRPVAIYRKLQPAEIGQVCSPATSPLAQTAKE